MSRIDTTDDTLKAMRQDRIEFRIFFVLYFPLFLLATIFSRLVSARPGSTSGFRRQGRPVFAEAKAAAYTVLPFAFMGW